MDNKNKKTYSLGFEEKRFFYLKDLVNNFQLTVLSGHSKLNKKIQTFGINRPELELADFYLSDRNQRICIIGGKESTFLADYDQETRMKRFTKLIENLKSALVITSRFQFKSEIIDICLKHDFPLFESKLSSTEFLIELAPWISKKLSNRLELHASLMSVYGEGVLIKGVSGIGKSEICMALLSRNHFFVGDDRIVVYRSSNDLYGSSSPIIKNIIEIRGIGVLNAEKVFGAYKVLDETKISCIIKLKTPKTNSKEEPRFKFKQKTTNILGVKIPIVNIPVLPGRSIPLLIEAAVIKIKMQNKGVNFFEELEDRFIKFSKKGTLL